MDNQQPLTRINLKALWLNQSGGTLAEPIRRHSGLMSLVWYALLWFGMDEICLVWLSLVCYGCVWYGVGNFGLVRMSLVWCGYVWFGMDEFGFV